MKYVAVFLCTILSSILYGQTVATQLDRENIVYLGIDNPMTVAVEGYSCKSIFLTTDNGTISGENGHYILNPDHPTSAMMVYINTKTIKGIKVLGKSSLRAKCIPAPLVTVSGSKGGKITANRIHSCTRPTAYFDGFEFDGGIIIDKIKVIVIRNEEIIFNKILQNEQRGVGFLDDEETKKMIQELKPNDTLKLFDMTFINHAKNCSNRLQPVEFTIIE